MKIPKLNRKVCKQIAFVRDLLSLAGIGYVVYASSVSFYNLPGDVKALKSDVNELKETVSTVQGNLSYIRGILKTESLINKRSIQP